MGFILLGGVTTENLAGETVAEEKAEEAKNIAPAFTRDQVVEALQKSVVNAFDKKDRIAADNWNAKLTKSQVFNYEFDKLPVEIQKDITTFYK
jgi:folylpolyglutamate synthase/dihydropteroate synthase